jgi:2-succinyl-5-enolpyruvyl-6-hydroxy-3-cyclohexene-1-carboxylate synthase
VNPSTAAARAVVEELVARGVTEAVLCPGSRNAPMSYALHAADATGRLRLHVRIDERTAGFLALGLARRSGRPVPVVCTSGTAAANLYPAVLEARYGGVPLLALTADRPPGLRGTGANQTIEQDRLYGSAPVAAADLPEPGGPDGRPADWRAAVGALARAAVAGPGPVHVNLPFPEPLVPDLGDTFLGAAARPGRDEPGATAAGDVPGAGPVDGPGPAEPLPMDPHAPTLVIGGSVPVGAPWVETYGAPVVAEPTSPLWPSALRAGPWLLGEDGPPRPEQVLLHGRPTLHRAFGRLIGDDSVRVYGVAGTNVAGWPRSVRAVGTPPPRLDPPGEWTQRWERADAVVGRTLEPWLDPSPTGLRLAATLVAALPEGSVLTLGSSNPVRDVSLAARPRSGVTVLANRGVAGIDGTVSTAIGAALAHRAAGGGPGYALLGDLTLLHDTTGLLLGPGEPTPDLTIVVLNDVGGGIFSLLEQGEAADTSAFERVFGTPHPARLDLLCAGAGVPHVLVGDLRELPDALAPGPGLRVVEVPADRAGLRTGHEALDARVRKALREAAG